MSEVDQYAGTHLPKTNAAIFVFGARLKVIPLIKKMAAVRYLSIVNSGRVLFSRAAIAGKIFAKPAE